MSISRNPRWLSIVGARPQFVKLAPLCRAIERYNSRHSGAKIDHRIVHTGQHYDFEMTDCFFEDLQIPRPDYNLGTGSDSMGQQISTMIARLEPILVNERPDWVLVYGDTNSTLAGALIAARLGLSLTHVEAGCRSYKPGMPEEQNRVATDHLSQLLLVSSRRAEQNLRREGIGTKDDPIARRVAMVGDTMHDALLANISTAEHARGNALHKYGVDKKGYYLLTLHRSENTENCDALQRVLYALGGLPVPTLFPVHPRTRKLLPAGEWANRNILISPPVNYLEMLVLEKHARAVLTDSGGVQKEAFYLRVPCITLRQETEWPETVELGANRLAGTDPAAILAAIRAPFSDLNRLRSPFGDGNACELILDELLFSSAQPSAATNRNQEVESCQA